MDYIELDITVSPRQPASEILISELADSGFESFADTPNGFLAYIPEKDFSDSLMSVFQDIDPDLAKVSVKVNKIAGQNWNAEWEKQYEPIEIGGRVLIRAPFHESGNGAEIELEIQPQQSFGTGHHPTTRLMAEKLLTIPLSGRYILDMGCGTGVLAILASRLGAAEALGIDIETNAVENARENVQRNKISNVSIEEGTEASLNGRMFDLILANINKNILLGAMPVYTAALKSKGDLLLSGFFQTDVAELVDSAGMNGLQFKSAHNEGEWAMLHFKKP